eukprot:scaffold39887_cov229-Amphora_coffeaeformis.AAC.10
MMKQVAVLAALLATASAFAPARCVFSKRSSDDRVWQTTGKDVLLGTGTTLWLPRPPVVSRTTSLAAEWKPADGEWKEKDYEKELAKLEKEAEERLDAKIAEMMAKIETTGQK